jgi:hypothetical protein
VADFVQQFTVDDQGLEAKLRTLAGLEEELGRKAKEAGDEAQDAGQKAGSGWGVFRDVVLAANQALELGGRIARSVTSLFDSTVGAAARQRTGILQLNNALQATLGQGYDAARNRIEAFASAQQASTRYGDDVTRSVMREVAQSLYGVATSYEQIERVTRLAQDAQEALGASTQGTSQAIARAVGGQVRALRSLLPEYSDLERQLETVTDRAQRLDIILQALEVPLGGSAQNIDEVEQASSELASAWSDLREAAGELAIAAGAPGVVRAFADQTTRVRELIDGTHAQREATNRLNREYRRQQAIMRESILLMDRMAASGNEYGVLWTYASQQFERADRVLLELADSLERAAEGHTDAAAAVTEHTAAIKEFDEATRLLQARLKAEADRRAEQEARDAEREADRRRREAERAREQTIRDAERHRQHVADLIGERKDLEDQRQADELRREVEHFAKLQQAQRDYLEATLAAEEEYNQRAKAQERELRRMRDESAAAALASQEAIIDGVRSGLAAAKSLAAGEASIAIPIELAEAGTDIAAAATAFAALNFPQGIAFTASAAQHIQAAAGWRKAGGKGGGGASVGAGGRGGAGGASAGPRLDPRTQSAPDRRPEDRGFGGTTFIFTGGVLVDQKALGRATTQAQRVWGEYRTGDSLPASLLPFTGGP